MVGRTCCRAARQPTRRARLARTRLALPCLQHFPVFTLGSCAMLNGTFSLVFLGAWRRRGDPVPKAAGELGCLIKARCCVAPAPVLPRALNLPRLHTYPALSLSCPLPHPPRRCAGQAPLTWLPTQSAPHAPAEGPGHIRQRRLHSAVPRPLLQWLPGTLTHVAPASRPLTATREAVHANTSDITVGTPRVQTTTLGQPELPCLTCTRAPHRAWRQTRATLCLAPAPPSSWPQILRPPARRPRRRACRQPYPPPARGLPCPPVPWRPCRSAPRAPWPCRPAPARWRRRRRCRC